LNNPITPCIYGWHTIISTLKLNPNNLQRIFLQKNRKDIRAQEVMDLASKLHIPLEIIERDELDTLAQKGKHQGVVGFLNAASSVALNENHLDVLLSQLSAPRLILVLDEIQDPHNLGACLRTADASGVQVVLIPKDKSCEITPLVRKVASGAAEKIPVIAVTNLSRVLEKLKSLGFWIYGLAGEASDSLYQTQFDEHCVIVLGAEGQGMRRLTKEKCDFLLRIPMKGHVESLNVSVACGITLFEVVRQQQ
jgi:23S rRNA (guanosine2251-2'-O)-methyltransferase